jgi:HAD superfamily hydrolase (TIGR01509 family)
VFEENHGARDQAGEEEQEAFEVDELGVSEVHGRLRDDNRAYRNAAATCTFPAMIRALIFDMDGLMLDTEKLYWAVGRELGRAFGRRVSDETLRKMTGRDRLQSSRILAEEAGMPIPPEELMARREWMMLERFNRGGLEPMRGLREILTRFRGRLKMGVATSSPRMLVTAALPALKVDHYFDAITAGDEVPRGKPDPALYLKTMEKLGVRGIESVVLEDAPSGAEAGKRAGAFVLAVPSELTKSEDFTGVANARVNDLIEAADLVEKLLAAQSSR